MPRPRTIATACVTALLASTARAAEPQITATQARDYVGKRVTVCGEVVATITMETPRAGGEQLFFHFEQGPPNSPFIAAVIGTELINGAFRGIDKTVNHRTVCVTGSIKQKGTTPLMVLSGPNQVKVMKTDEK
jgi:hypothetical protein